MCALQSCTPRWQTCIGNTDDTMGFALGALFVKETFDRNSKGIVRLPQSTPGRHFLLSSVFPICVSLPPSLTTVDISLPLSLSD